MVFALFLVGAYFCEALPLANGAMQGVKHLARTIQDFVRRSSRTPQISSVWCWVLSSTFLQLLAIWYLVQTIRTERAYHSSTARNHAGAQRQPKIFPTGRLLRCKPYTQCSSNVSQMFGFKYNLANTEVGLDRDEVANVRCRLFLRAIRINGLSQADMLLPHLQAKLESGGGEDRSLYKF